MLLLNLSNIKQHGFSLIELMIVFALMGMLGAFVVPNLFTSKQGAERKQFLTSLESMMKNGILRSIELNQVHQVYFNIEKEVVQLRIIDEASVEANVHKRFKVLIEPEFKTQIQFFKNFKIKNFFINGDDEVQPGKNLEDVLFYIMPDGTSQAVVVNIVDENEDATQDVNFSFVVNPFYARMSVYETFQTP